MFIKMNFLLYFHFLVKKYSYYIKKTISQFQKNKNDYKTNFFQEQ